MNGIQLSSFSYSFSLLFWSHFRRPTRAWFGPTNSLASTDWFVCMWHRRREKERLNDRKIERKTNRQREREGGGQIATTPTTAVAATIAEKYVKSWHLQGWPLFFSLYFVCSLGGQKRVCRLIQPFIRAGPLRHSRLRLYYEGYVGLIVCFSIR